MLSAILRLVAALGAVRVPIGDTLVFLIDDGGGSPIIRLINLRRLSLACVARFVVDACEGEVVFARDAAEGVTSMKEAVLWQAMAVRAGTTLL